MNKTIFQAAALAGALALLWIASGFVSTQPLALAVTLVIAGVYGFGALELHRFRQDTARLQAALQAVPDTLAHLGDWLGAVPAALQNPVRLRIEGERVGLPGPALTPYLVGLLVMLGMLGTFLGMVATLNGAVFALEGTADLAAIRSAFAVPIKGLGLAFGTSVAGVATSAMLGLMSALSRRERQQAAQQLDGHINGPLRPFSQAYQREQTLRAMQAQSQALPTVLHTLQAMVQQMERTAQQTNERLLGNQQAFHSQAQGVYTELARALDQSLHASLARSAQVAGEQLQPVLHAALQGAAHEASRMHQRMVDSAETQLHALTERLDARAHATLGEITRLLQTSEELVRTRIATEAQWTEQHGARMDQLSAVLGRELGALREAEALRLAETAACAAALGQVSTQFRDGVDAQAARLEAVVAQVGAGAVDIASLGETLGVAVHAFADTNDRLMASLQRIEGALDQSMVRSDEQLAYCVAQAREVIDLSISAQQDIVGALRQVASRPPQWAGEPG